MAFKKTKMDASNWDGVRIEEEKMMEAKLAGSSKSRLSWGYSYIRERDWDRIFGKRDAC
jgi:hypothetical protein